MRTTAWFLLNYLSLGFIYSLVMIHLDSIHCVNIKSCLIIGACLLIQVYTLVEAMQEKD